MTDIAFRILLMLNSRGIKSSGADGKVIISAIAAILQISACVRMAYVASNRAPSTIDRVTALENVE